MGLVKVAGYVMFFSPFASRNDAGNKMMRLGAFENFGWGFSKKLFPGDNLESQGRSR